jgi:DNA replication and repair protein RecF
VFLRRLTLSDFRNYAALEIDPAPGLNVFVGDNAQGKSNLLEGIAMLGTGKSFRTARDADTIRQGCARAVLHGEATMRAGSVDLTCAIERSGRGTQKTYTVNGSAVRYAGYLGRIRVVPFVPLDLQLASGPPGTRRAFLNGALSQSEPGYYHELARYRKALQQKNALLRGAVALDAELLAIYDATLIDAGTHLIASRRRFVAELAERAAPAHRRFAAGEQLDLTYDPDVVSEDPSAEAVAKAFAERLQGVAEAERLRKSAVAGPHRDDLALDVNGVALAAYGSQGQQRTAVLALKIAEYQVMKERASEAPLLLLDDVLSELDEERGSAFLAEISAYEQAFVTATHSPPGLPAGARVARVRQAAVYGGALC